MTGLVHIYCGDGKGKTTAALGLALRGAGSGLRVHIVQLMKGRDTGELAALAMIPNITVARCDRDYGFVRRMTEEDKRDITHCHARLLSDAKALAESGGVDLLILDEFNGAYAHGLLDRATAENLVLHKPEGVELVLTGRNPAEVFLRAADYVSDIAAIKHPYERGITARKGIEY